MRKRKQYTLDDISPELRAICSDEDLQTFLDDRDQGLINLHCIQCGTMYNRKNPWKYLSSDLMTVTKDTLLLCNKCARVRAATENGRKMWDNPDSVQKFKESRKSYYKTHPEEKELLAKKISESMKETLKVRGPREVGDEERLRRSETLKNFWDSMTPEYREEFLQRRVNGIKESKVFKDSHAKSTKRIWDTMDPDTKSARLKPWIESTLPKNNPNISKVRSLNRVTYYKEHPEERYNLANYISEHPECISILRRSAFELDIEEYIRSLGLTTKHDRAILNPMELDIYLPEKGVAIECNGLYWHGCPLEYFQDANGIYPSRPYTYHVDNFQQCKDKGIHLIQITDYDWYTNQAKIKNYLQDVLTEDKEIYYARKLALKPIDPLDAKHFYQEHHLQGCNIQFPINYGLHDGEELISCISFGKSRVRNTTNPEGHYELHRYCTKSNCTVLGGAERLFKHFISTYDPTEVKSFSDNDYFSGGIYERLGFTSDDQIRVYYWYNLHTGDVRARENCQLKVLKDLFPEDYIAAVALKESKDISNQEVYIMESNGYRMYMTSGRTKWIWRKECV